YDNQQRHHGGLHGFLPRRVRNLLQLLYAFRKIGRRSANERPLLLCFFRCHRPNKTKPTNGISNYPETALVAILPRSCIEHQRRRLSIVMELTLPLPVSEARTHATFKRLR